METTQNKERRSVSRQFHRKSRNSCIPCRQRHVRCNLQPPICANCHRRNESCSYISGHSGDVNAPGVSVPWGIANGIYGVRQLDKGSGSSSVIDFMEKTFFLSGLTAFDRATLAQEFDHQASTFEYVHRTMTALYALHESCQEKSHNLQAAAYQNHIEASILFRKSQIQVNEANWMAILMFGIGVIVFQFAEALNTSNEADDYLQVLYILRNSFNLGSEVAPYFLASPLMQFTGPQLSQLKLPLDGFTWNAICRLDSLNYPKDTPDTIKCACLHSIVALKEWVIMVQGHPRNWRHFIDWPAAVSMQFLSALSAMKHLGGEWDHILEFPRSMLTDKSTSDDFFRLALMKGT
ncbi:hypothetical protein M434DRAFT_273757 [Hypoxylon sp. CO27-5]|nr:hypothetical protein M434DRAFT_273757 [Hypoxylon sp. CO27-5]